MGGRGILGDFRKWRGGGGCSEQTCGEKRTLSTWETEKIPGERNNLGRPSKGGRDRSAGRRRG